MEELNSLIKEICKNQNFEEMLLNIKKKIRIKK